MVVEHTHFCVEYLLHSMIRSARHEHFAVLQIVQTISTLGLPIAKERITLGMQFRIRLVHGVLWHNYIYTTEDISCPIFVGSTSKRSKSPTPMVL